MVWLALALAILSGLAWLLLLAAEIYSVPIAEVWLNGGVWQVATDTRFGLVWGARAALAVLLGLLMLRPALRLLQLASAAGLIALLALIGHAGAAPGFAGTVHLAADTVHLLAAGCWLGGLPALALLLALGSHDPAWRAVVVAAIRRFSVLGIVCVAVLLASGAVNAWNLLSGPRDLMATGYGLLVLLKIGLFPAMVALAAFNRYRLTPQLPAPAAQRALRRNSLAEFGLGLCVLVLVGALGTIAPTAHVHISSSEIPPDAAFVHIHTEQAMTDVTIDPGRTGRVRATIHVLREDFTELAAKAVSLALDPPASGEKSVARATVRKADGTWQADGINIPQSGIWTVRVTVTPESGEPIVLDAPILIGR
jgi:putative copper resistance protein D